MIGYCSGGSAGHRTDRKTEQIRREGIKGLRQFMYPTNEQEALEALKGKDPELAATAEAILWGSALGVRLSILDNLTR